MSSTITVLGNEFKKFYDRESIEHLTNKDTGTVLVIDKLSQQVNVHVGVLKGILRLRKDLLDDKEVYYYRDTLRNDMGFHDHMAICKFHVELAFLDKLDSKQIQKSRLREILALKRTSPDRYRSYVEAIEGLEEKISKTINLQASV